jgi:pre-mRNA-processing factor 19
VFHPDGHLFATGGGNGQIKLFNTTTGDSAADFDATEPIQNLAFSENGTWLASVSKGQTSVQIWDLRKAAQIASLELETEISKVSFDYTGQYLLAAGSNGLVVQHYSKSIKEWSELLRNGTAAIAAVWGPRAGSIFVLSKEGAIVKLA